MNGWDQSTFDKTLKDYLAVHEREVWPRAINKKGFFVALAALKFTERAEPEKIYAELGREITATREDGTSGPLPVGMAIAAKRASKHWVGSRQFRNAQKRRLRGLATNELDAWRKLFAEKFRTMLGGRKAAAGFIRAGWVFVLRDLGPKIGGSYNRGGDERNVRGGPKGRSQAATPGKLQVVIENTAVARSEHRGGFHRIGDAGLQMALDQEAASMREHLEEEMKPEADRFNRRQH